MSLFAGVSGALKNRRGLTLVEIVIGLGLTAVIALILLSALRLAHRSEEAGQEREEVSQRMRIISDRLSWLIRGAYPYTVVEEGERMVYFDGGTNSLGFVTTSTDSYSSGPEDAAGLKWVGLYADSRGLVISENVFFLQDVMDEAGREYVFDPTVTQIGFEYLDIDYGDEDDEDEQQKEAPLPEWVSSWHPEDKDYLPSAVRMKVVFEHNGKLIAIPEITAAIRAVKKQY